MENNRLEQIKEGILGSSFTISGEKEERIINGRKGNIVERHTLSVLSANDSDLSDLLVDDPQVYRWDQENGRLFAVDVNGGFNTSIVIELLSGLERRI